MKIVLVKNKKDLESIRKLNQKSLALILLKDVELDREYDPIDKADSNIIIYGNGKKIINLNINRPTEKCNGIFSKVKNLIVENLDVIGASIVSGEVCGTLAGEVEEELYARNVRVDATIDADSIVGGLAGIAQKAYINNCVILGNYSARGVIGGLIGMSEEINTSKNRYHNIRFDTKENPQIDTIGIEVGYLSSEKKDEITRMLKPVMKEKKNYYSE